MHRDRYASLTNPEHTTYEFLSTGPKGTIKKVVQYTEIEPGVYNLGFGDWDEATQTVRDDIRSNNEDRDKVLATVAATVIDFMQHYPEAVIVAEGSTPARTRLYQLGIYGSWDEISQLFEVKGLREGAWENFQKRKNYKAFAVRAK